jgi:hypothetical protein
MSRVGKDEKIVQQAITREESKQLTKAYESSKEVQEFRKEFHDRIARLGK